MSDKITEADDVTDSERAALREEQREARSLKFWLVKAFTVTFLFVFASSVATLIYAALVKDKDLDTGYLGTVFKLIFEFLTFALT